MEKFMAAVAFVDGIIIICGALAFFIKPIRSRLFRDKEQREGTKCLLRSQMLSIYYRCKDTETIRQYEYENFIACYKAYKAMGGNSFIDHIKDEIDTYKVVS